MPRARCWFVVIMWALGRRDVIFEGVRRGDHVCVVDLFEIRGLHGLQNQQFCSIFCSCYDVIYLPVIVEILGDYFGVHESYYWTLSISRR